MRDQQEASKGEQVRIAELSHESGVAIPTIKYYLREGLLPPGERTSRNQARYDAGHLRKLRLIRALIDVGGLPVATVRDVVSAIDEPDRSVHQRLGAVSAGLSAPRLAADDTDTTAAREQVDALIARHGWQVSPEAPELDVLAKVIEDASRLGHHGLVELLDTYFRACEPIAEADLGYVSRLGTMEDIAEGVVMGTVFGETALTAIRRLAHHDASARRYGTSGHTAS